MIIANMATYPKRSDILKETLPKIADQVDRLNLVLNEYEEIPDWLADVPSVVPVIPETDLKDVGKFLPSIPASAQAVFLVDDDLVYPEDYVAKSLKRLDQLGQIRAVMGYHYSIYRGPRPIDQGRAYKRDVIHFGKPRGKFRYVDQLGSGTAVLRPSDLPPLDYMQGSQKFVDVRLARWCFEQGIAQIAAPRSEQWIVNAPVEETIFETFTLTFPENVDDEILSFAFKRDTINQEVFADSSHAS